MVSKITLLEPHFEGAQFGPEMIDANSFGDRFGQSGAQQSNEDEESSGQKSRATMVIQGLIGFVLMFIVLYASLRALSSDDEE